MPDPLPCSQHPQRLVHTACSRCGEYVCDLCLAPVQRTQPLCIQCDERMVAETRVALALPLRFCVAVLLTSSLLSALQIMPMDQESTLLLDMLITVFYLLEFVAFAVWYRRANLALTRRGYELEFGRHAWLWHMVPVANLYMPYRVLQEIYERAVIDVGFALPIWWGLRIASSLGRWSVLSSSNGSASWLAWLMSGSLAISELALMLVLLRSTRGLSTPFRPVVLGPSAPLPEQPAFSEFL